jgi:hypothetical protein
MKKLLPILLILFPIVSHAGYWVTIDIIDIRAFTDQQSHFIGVKNFTNPEGCSVTGTVVLERMDTANWKMVHSLLVTGFVSGSKVSVRTAGCRSDGQPVIDGAMIYK